MDRPSRRPRLVATVTALLVALSTCVVLLVGTAGSTAAARSAVVQAGQRSHAQSRSSDRSAAAKQGAADKRRAARKATAERRAAKRAARRAERRKAARLRARLARVNPRRPSTWLRYAPVHSDPPSGAHFNNPYGSRPERRTLINQVIAAIDAAPGYARPDDRRTHRPRPCPTKPRLFPSRIRIAVYSVTDRPFADALVAAHRRCVSVQVLMNSHLTTTTSPAWGELVHALGERGSADRHPRSFAHRCSNGCLGSAVLHSKFYLFSRSYTARDTVMVGSSNMSGNAGNIQWNDLYTVSGNRQLFAQYRRMFAAMVPDRAGSGPRVYQAGQYTSMFYPFRRATSKTDLTMRQLRTITCSGAKHGAGIHRHSVLYVAMHSWHGTRGLYLARQVRQMYERGCYVRILYSFMSARVYAVLTDGAGRRLVARRVLFGGPRGVVAAKYSHLKMFAASGSIAGDRSSWVVWTGSSNWSDRATRSDEVTLRIPSKSAYGSYVDHWKFIRHRRSSARWATFREPVGGGRAP
jgi:PLD-like domain